MRRALLLALGTLGLFAVPASAQDGYVPASAGRDPDDVQGNEERIGEQLRAMGEPILSRPGDLGRFHSRLRLLVLPTFRPGYAIRVDESGSGGEVSFVELDGRGGYAPGRVRRRFHYRLTPVEMRDVHRVVRQFGLASAPAVAPPAPAEPEFTPDGEQIVHFCGDVTSFVIELANASGSHFVLRSQCDASPEMLALANELLSLTPYTRRWDRR